MILVAEGNVPQVSYPWSMGRVDYELYREGEELTLFVCAGEPDPRTRVRGNSSAKPIALVPIIRYIGQWNRGGEYWGTDLAELLPGSTVDRGFVVAVLRDLRVLEETGPNESGVKRGMPSRVHPDFDAEAWLKRMMEATPIDDENGGANAIES